MRPDPERDGGRPRQCRPDRDRAQNRRRQEPADAGGGSARRAAAIGLGTQDRSSRYQPRRLRRGLRSIAVSVPDTAAYIMLLVKTYLDKSPIHGIGVFARESIPKGKKIWRFVFGFDRYYSRKQLAKLPKAAKEHIRLHGFQWKNEILLSMDYDTFMNHSENPNTYFHNGYVVARCNIRKGAEITNDYRAFKAAFCAAFLKKKSGAAKR